MYSPVWSWIYSAKNYLKAWFLQQEWIVNLLTRSRYNLKCHSKIRISDLMTFYPSYFSVLDINGGKESSIKYQTHQVHVHINRRSLCFKKYGLFYIHLQGWPSTAVISFIDTYSSKRNIYETVTKPAKSFSSLTLNS